MNNISILILCLSLIVLSFRELVAQDFSKLVEMAWSNNDQLTAKHFELDQARASLQEAKGAFRPSITFGTQYTLAAGGRTIDFPIGDLLNPVHSSLNELTGSSQFPTLENQTILFLPNNFLDARVRFQQPIYFPDLKVNRLLKDKEIDLKSLEIRAFKRLLVKDLMQAYFVWRQSILAIEIYRNADTLLQEASRSTQRLLRNGVALPSALSRINAEIATVKGQLIEAQVQEKNAWSYLLFYVGDNGMTREQLNMSLPDIPNMAQPTNNTREELAQLEVGRQMQDLALEKEKVFYKPRLAAQLDMGSQDFNFGIEPYALLGLNLEINIFDGGKNKARQAQAMAAISASEAQIKHHTDQLALQNQITLNNLIAAVDQVNTYQPRIDATSKTYQEVIAKYRQGTVSYLELLDARTQIMQSELAFLLATFQAWNRWAEHQFTSAAYPINE